jgi:hypothetical protein
VFYTVLLFLHSWLRWGVVALIVIALTRALRGARSDVPWSDADSRVRVASVAAFDTQVMLGVLLFFVSPMTPKSGAAFGAYMKVSQLRFFTVEHGFAMILALAALHVGSVKSKRADNDHDRHKKWAVAVSVALFFVLAGIPWPFLPYARPLFRLP